jgi:predicted nucleotidyltransferase
VRSVDSLPESLRCAVEDLRERLVGLLGPDLLALWLFGSFARAAAHEESDVDVAIVVTELDHARWRAIIDCGADVSLAHDLVISPMVFDRATYAHWRRQERPLVMDIEREGIPL